jgi:hypothetical protein
MISVFALIALALGPAERISTTPPTTPSAVRRQDASNFKDMVLAICVARTYQQQAEASADAASSARALVDWTKYDAESAPDEIDRLINAYTRRDYRNPLGDEPARSSKFGFLKCLDLYHSKELDRLTRRVVPAADKAKRE